MLRNKDCVAMLLAGGQGSRLGILTQNMAKPAIPFGGKYRIIDFPLSNCSNSGIDTVGVLTQYRPLELNSYIGAGQPWDLDLNNGGVFVLPPYMTAKRGEWYRGTANAIYQNIGFIAQYDPNYVLILSGDHIYKMDYAQMIRAHRKNEADATIAVLEVPWEETYRFGIMNTDEEGRVTQFEEKPKHARSNKASMGVYVFTWPKLRQYLELDEADPNSSNDFGKNVIPRMLGDGQRLFAYAFSGYWKDVGAIESLWEANMDLLGPSLPINLYDKNWRIYARNPGMPPHYVSAGSKVSNSLITEGGVVFGCVEHSVLFAGVTVEEGALVRDAVVMPGAVIRSGARVERAIIAEDAVIGPGCVVGEETGLIAVVGHGVTLNPGLKVAAGEQCCVESIAAKGGA
ncbi:MAG: glucose-1-phosphate adenylyltransferase [Oscillospiraceae bacterium]|jgi:glucose-1-phosphate adenylyltransferase|nr:glucose-1-phosphate adenylyltransferase [Oscillospiraceae bacterium]